MNIKYINETNFIYSKNSLDEWKLIKKTVYSFYKNEK